MQFGIGASKGDRMSVQAGVWNFDGRPVERRLIDDLSASLKQQGPECESSFLDRSIALIYRPFHTTAESRLEKQPYFSRRGFVLMWDGRLDNREGLIAELCGDLDDGATDVAIVAAAFDQWDTDCFRRIIGDWAITSGSPNNANWSLPSTTWPSGISFTIWRRIE